MLDQLEVYKEDQKKGKTPFVLVDGHSSRFNLEFLNYINDDEHPWTVCIGVPYGTSHWQVGDSSQQNGAFKMALTKWKGETMQRRDCQLQSELGILSTDIILMVNYAWDKSFAVIESNKDAIAERGRFPFNWNCLLLDNIRSSMTLADIKEEKKRDCPHSTHQWKRK